MFDKTAGAFEQELRRAELSMTPLIDMVFILLIFFVVTTTFTKETGITVDKAEAATAQLVNDRMILIAIDRHGGYWCEGRRRELDELVDYTEKQYRGAPDAKIVLIPDKNGRVEPLIAIMDRLRSRAIYRFSLGTRLHADADE